VWKKTEREEEIGRNERRRRFKFELIQGFLSRATPSQRPDICEGYTLRKLPQTCPRKTIHLIGGKHIYS